MIQGEFSFAYLNKSLTLEAPTPTNISINSAAEIEIKGTPASPATAFASIVFPVPGGPTSNAPLGIFAPNLVYFYGVSKCVRSLYVSPFPSLRPHNYCSQQLASSILLQFQVPP
mgnify:CR=1 FL=1